MIQIVRRKLGSWSWGLLLLLLAGSAAEARQKSPDAESEEFLRNGLRLLLENDYATAETLFEREAGLRPNDPLPLVALLFVYQAQMYELDDFARQKEFDERGGRALGLIRKDIERRNLAWDHTLEATIYGMQGLQQARREHWVGAARLGLKAKNALDRALKVDPEFADACLGLGVFRYYGSVLTKKYWFLPGFGDQREQGLADVLRARDGGLYLREVAEFALLYVYYEEKRYAEALELANTLVQRWPRNTLARSWIGWMQMKLGRPGEAAETFRVLCEEGPQRYHCLYHLAHCRFLDGRDPELALATFQKFLQSEPQNWWRARAYYRIGLLQLRLGRPEAGRAALQAATYIDPGYKLPRDQLTQLERDEALEGSRKPTPPVDGAAPPGPETKGEDS